MRRKVFVLLLQLTTQSLFMTIIVFLQIQYKTILAGRSKVTTVQRFSTSQFQRNLSIQQQQHIRHESPLPGSEVCSCQLTVKLSVYINLAYPPSRHKDKSSCTLTRIASLDHGP